VSNVSSIRNLGPAVEAMFAQIGITTAEQLIDIGADDAYRQLLANGVRPHFIGYYALVMGLQGRPWNDCQGKEKDALRTRFETLKAARPVQAANKSEIEAVLDRIGVIKPER